MPRQSRVFVNLSVDDGNEFHAERKKQYMFIHG